MALFDTHNDCAGYVLWAGGVFDSVWMRMFVANMGKERNDRDDTGEQKVQNKRS